MAKRSCRVQCVWLVSLVLLADTACADPRGPNPPPVIEVFTSAERPLIETDANDSGGDLQGLAITVYEIDGIQSLERELSLDLPVEPQPSKAMVLRRIQQLDVAGRAQVQHTALGLAKAVQYGVDRYPAIVLDGEVAIYGVTDIREALQRYQQWREGGTQ